MFEKHISLYIIGKYSKISYILYIYTIITYDILEGYFLKFVSTPSFYFS